MAQRELPGDGNNFPESAGDSKMVVTDCYKIPSPAKEARKGIVDMEDFSDGASYLQ